MRQCKNDVGMRRADGRMRVKRNDGVMIYITGDLHGEIERLESKAVKKIKKAIR